MSKLTGLAYLLTAMLICITLWGVVFPRMAKWDSVRNRADRYSKAGIHPAAIYYSDHPGMSDIESRVDRKMSR